MKSVGIRRSKATPIQKREKRTAVMRERSSRPVTKERKRRMGVSERRNWIARKDYLYMLACGSIEFDEWE